MCHNVPNEKLTLNNTPLDSNYAINTNKSLNIHNNLKLKQRNFSNLKEDHIPQSPFIKINIPQLNESHENAHIIQTKTEAILMSNNPEELNPDLSNLPITNTTINLRIKFDEIESKCLSNKLLTEKGEIEQNDQYMEQLVNQLHMKHPHHIINDKVKPIPLCVNTGNFCFSSRKFNHIRTTVDFNTDSLGIGIVLYFKLLKTLIISFIIATLLSIPIIAIYYSNHKEKLAKGYMDHLFKTTIGNIGSSTYNCHTISINKHHDSKINIGLNCGTKMILYINSFGQAKNNQLNKFNCYNFLQVNNIIVDKECNLTNELQSAFVDKCTNRTDCIFSYDIIDIANKCTITSNDPLYVSYTCYDRSIDIGVGELRVNRSVLGFITVSLDLCEVIAIFIALIIIDVYHKKDLHYFNKNHNNIKDYTLFLDGMNIPKKDISKEIGHIAKHLETILSTDENCNKLLGFQEFPHDIQIDYCNYIESFSSIYDPGNFAVYEVQYPYLTCEKLDAILLYQQKEKKREKIKTQKISPKILKKCQTMNKEMKTIKNQINDDETKNLHAVHDLLITFRNYQIANYYNVIFNKSRCNRCCIIICCKYKYIKKYYYKGKWLNFGIMRDDPSNIKWENMTYPQGKRFLRKAFSLLCALIIMLITLSLVIIAKYYENTLSNEYNMSIDCTFIDTSIENIIKEEFNDSTKTSKEKVLSYCFCKKKLDISSFIGNELENYTFKDTDITPCKGFIHNLLIHSSIIICLIISIPIVNSLVIILFKQFTSFERNKTLSRDIVSNILKMFFVQFFNTGVLLVLVNIQIDSIKQSMPQFPFFTGNYKDLNPEWYNNIGVAILFSMLLSIISPHCAAIIEVIYNHLFRCCDSGCYYGRKTKKATKEEYFNLYTGPIFPIDSRYASILSSYYITLILSSGMPMLYLCFLLFLFTTFIVDKFLILRFYCNPPKYDASIINLVIFFGFFGLVLHLLFAIWIYGNPFILYNNESNNFIPLIKSLIEMIIPDNTELSNRITLGHNQLILLFIGIIIVFLLIFMLLRTCMALCSYDGIQRKIMKLDKDSIEIGLAVPLKDMYKSYMLKEIQFFKMMKQPDDNQTKEIKKFLAKRILYDRAFMIYKLEILTKRSVEDLRKNFDQEIGKYLDYFEFDRKTLITGEVSYDIAFVPRFETVAYYEHLKNI